MKKITYLLVLIILTMTLMACSESSGNENLGSTAEVITEDAVGTSDKISNETSSGSNDVINNLDQGDEIVLGSESILITEAGTYYFTGSLDNGQIIVDSDDSAEVQIVLNNVVINCDYSAAIYVKEAEDVIITSEGNNLLSIEADISDNVDSVDGVIYSKSDVTFNGNGSLSIESEYTHGIVGKDDVEFIGGTYLIDVEKDGVQANDSVSLVDASMSVTSGNDGIQVANDENTDKGYIYLSNSTIALTTGQDGMNASNYIQIDSGDYTIDSALDGIQADISIEILGGRFDITSGGGYQGVLNIITKGEGSGGVVSETDKLDESMKGLKSNDIIVEDGDFIVSSYEDGFNAKNDLTINGGSITVNSGDEAFTAKNELIVNDGSIVVENGYEGLEAVYITINGGDVTINVLDDGINGGETYSLVTIAGGNLSVACQGDGLDSNGDMVISGGNIILDVTAIYAGGDGNVDVTGTLTYTGGNITDASGNTIDPTQHAAGGRLPGPGGGKR